ncbi:hypothetical protein GCM10010415_66460 [Streptomyces atrovirens]
MNRQAGAVFGRAWSCGEGKVVHAGDSVVETVATLPAVAEDLVVLQPGEGVLDTGVDPRHQRGPGRLQRELPHGEVRAVVHGHQQHPLGQRQPPRATPDFGDGPAARDTWA